MDRYNELILAQDDNYTPSFFNVVEHMGPGTSEARLSTIKKETGLVSFSKPLREIPFDKCINNWQVRLFLE